MRNIEFEWRSLTVRLSLLLPVALVAGSGVAQAPQAVSVTSEILAVKIVTDAKGAKVNTLVKPGVVVPGTPLVFVLRYKNRGSKSVTNYVVTNPIPQSVRFTEFAADSSWGSVSVDGGKTYGALSAQQVADKAGAKRAAQPSDVTHLRWTVAKPILPGTAGSVTFYGAVQ
jgi:uncharacterized repeat protein (TIGR01451 family)